MFSTVSICFSFVVEYPARLPEVWVDISLLAAVAESTAVFTEATMGCSKPVTKQGRALAQDPARKQLRTPRTGDFG